MIIKFKFYTITWLALKILQTKTLIHPAGANCFLAFGLKGMGIKLLRWLPPFWVFFLGGVLNPSLLCCFCLLFQDRVSSEALAVLELPL